MKTKELLYNINIFYENYVKAHDLPRLLQDVLKLYVSVTKSEVGFISSKFALNKATPVTAPIFLYLPSQEQILSDKTIVCSFKKRTLKEYIHCSQPSCMAFTDARNQTLYACIKDFQSLQHSITFALPISKQETILLGLANRKGNYSPLLKEKVRVTLETLTYLIRAYETEQSLQTNVELLNQFVKHVPAAVAMFDANMRYLMTSRQWLKQELNLPTRSLKNKSHYDIVKDIPDHWKDIHQRCLEGAVERNDGEKFLRSDGTVQWLKWEVRPWYKKKQVGGVLMFLEHITEQKKAQERLQQLIHDLRESNAQLERFAHVCSHDLKEPLRTIASFIQLIQRECKDLNNPHIVQYFEYVTDGVRRMRDLIDNLLLYSEMGAKKINLESFHLKEVLNVAIRNNAHGIQEKNATVRLDNDCEIYSDKFLIAQILHNLLSNALKYVKKTPPSIRVGVQPLKDAWKIYVKDNGIGIDKEYHETIFSRFKRLHSRNEYSGTGIGLAICKMIAEKQGGKIWVRSKADQGATFFFTIPYK